MRRLIPIWFVLAAAAAVSAQTLVRSDMAGGSFHPVISDMAILGSSDTRDDLPCRVEPLSPKLEFDLNFQAGYIAYVPLRALAGSGNSLRVLFRITPQDGGEPAYFRERYSVPAIEEDAKGDATLPGKYRLGPGRYRVDWLMRDRAERVCSGHWEVVAELLDGFDQLAATPADSLIAETTDEPFYEEPPVRRARGKLLHVKLLVNFTPMNPNSVSLPAYDLRSVVSMLRALAREPQIGRFSLSAFHMHEERVFFEETNAPRIDFQSLGESYQTVRGGVVDFQQLEDKKSHERFLRGLFEGHLRQGEGEDEPDAVIFIGPKLIFEKNPDGLLAAVNERTSAPVYYLIFDRNPRSYPWRDAISTALKDFPAKEYTVTSPKDFGAALQEIVGTLSKGGNRNASEWRARSRGQAAAQPRPAASTLIEPVDGIR